MTLDKNGYAESVIPDHSPTQCWLCDCNGRGKMDRHEVFGGAYRDKSKRLGLWVHLCHQDCHLDRIHGGDRHSIDLLKWEAQRCAMKKYGWTVEQFIEEFGKNYMEETNA